MTIDTVVEKTAITLGLLTLSAAVTWFLIGDLVNQTTGEVAYGKAATFATLGAIIGFALAMVNSFKKVISPALVLGYAVFEGIFIGAFSKVIAGYVDAPSIVFQAILGTMVAFFGTLAAYKFFNIQVTDRFRKIVTIAMFSVVGVLLLNMVLSLTGVFEVGRPSRFRHARPAGLVRARRARGVHADHGLRLHRAGRRGRSSGA